MRVQVLPATISMKNERLAQTAKPSAMRQPTALPSCPSTAFLGGIMGVEPAVKPVGAFTFVPSAQKETAPVRLSEHSVRAQSNKMLIVFIHNRRRNSPLCDLSATLLTNYYLLSGMRLRALRRGRTILGLRDEPFERKGATHRSYRLAGTGALGEPDHWQALPRNRQRQASAHSRRSR